jgi:hypothetical protein
MRGFVSLVGHASAVYRKSAQNVDDVRKNLEDRFEELHRSAAVRVFQLKRPKSVTEKSAELDRPNRPRVRTQPSVLEPPSNPDSRRNRRSRPHPLWVTASHHAESSVSSQDLFPETSRHFSPDLPPVQLLDRPRTARVQKTPLIIRRMGGRLEDDDV